MSNRFTNPRPQYFLADGSPLPKGEMAFKENGTDIDKDTFSDVNEKFKNPNPLPLTADGVLPNCFYAGTARTILTYDDGSGRKQRFDVDGVGMFGSGAAFDIWNSIVEYEDGALVEASDGEYYRSLQNNNTGNDPISSPTFWEQLEFLRTWNANVTYAADDIVIASNGLIFRSLQAANLNNDPLVSPTFWGTPVAFVDLNITGDLSFASTELTIAAGSVAAETSHHTIDTEAAAASDDLDTITVAGVADFAVLILRLEDAARVVTLKDNTGNIQTKGNEDIVLDANLPTILFRVGTDWHEIQRPGAFESLNVVGDLSFAASELTIAAGSVAAETSHHTIDTEADAASDDLDTITVAGVTDFAVLYLRLEDAARVVTLKDNTGNIQTKNNEDIILDANLPTILFRVGTDWFEVQRPVVDNPFDQDLNTTDDVSFENLTSANPRFLVFQATALTNVTGNGTVFHVQFASEIYDDTTDYNPGTGLFTAPETARFRFNAAVQVSDIVGGTTIGMNLVVSNRTVRLDLQTIIAGESFLFLTGTTGIDMDINDTAKIEVTGSGLGGDTMDVDGNASSLLITYFAGEKIV